MKAAWNLAGEAFFVMLLSGCTLATSATVGLVVSGSKPLCQLSVPKSDLASLGVSQTAILYLSDRSTSDISTIPEMCKAYVSKPFFEFSMFDCSPKLTKLMGSKAISAQHSLRAFVEYVRADGEPHASVNNVISLTCVYTGFHFESFDGVPSNPIREFMKPPIFKNALELTLYSDESFSSPLAPNSSLVVPDYLFGKVELIGLAGYIVQIKSCSVFFRRTKQLYQIIKDGCEIGNPVDKLLSPVEVIRNNRVDRALFKFSFTTLDNAQGFESVLLRCDVSACNNHSGRCPELDCGVTKRRRSAYNLRQIVSSSSVLFRLPKSCEENHGMCSDFCEMREKNIFCSCFGERVLDENAKTCVERSPYTRLGYYYKLYGAFLLLVTVSLVLSWTASKLARRDLMAMKKKSDTNLKNWSWTT